MGDELIDCISYNKREEASVPSFILYKYGTRVSNCSAVSFRRFCLTYPSLRASLCHQQSDSNPIQSDPVSTRPREIHRRAHHVAWSIAVYFCRSQSYSWEQSVLWNRMWCSSSQHGTFEVALGTLLTLLKSLLSPLLPEILEKMIAYWRNCTEETGVMVD